MQKTDNSIAASTSTATTTSASTTTFKIHPAIGIARLGNSDEFYLSPEQPGALPIECDDKGLEQQDKDGSPVRISSFKESTDLSKVKRQAARFRIFAYRQGDEDSDEEIEIGGRYSFVITTGITAPTQVEGTVTDINWTVHLANKKSSWYEFKETDGMHGYGNTHPLRNPEVVQPDLRRQLITDPGPQTVSLASPLAEFAKGKNPGYPQTFPPEDIKPNPISTLGELIANKQEKNPRLVVLGGRGNSGSTTTPVITSFVNNDGWFDDISDGPVSADIAFSYPLEETDANGKKTTVINSSTMQVQVPAWVVVGYPRYVPQMLDMITLDEAMFDLFVQNFQYKPRVFGVAPFDKAANSPKTEKEVLLWRNNAGFNPDYYPRFYRDIWPILERPDQYKYTYDFDAFSGGDPHNIRTGGNLDMVALSQPPINGEDTNLEQRQFILRILRQPLQENLYFNSGKSKINPDAKPRLMPMLCGNNPISNKAPQKFLTMTDTQLFYLRQWADGKFVNECDEWDSSDANCQQPWAEPPTSGIGIDRGVLSNLLGGAFCPGGEFSWIIINPAAYSSAYRIKHCRYQAGALSLPEPIADSDGSPAPDLAAGMEPGDLTKYIGIPWQADFHECTTQDIDITYDDWNKIELTSTGDPAQQEIAYEIPWWPAHRPMIVNTNVNPKYNAQVFWTSGVPDNNAGDLQMVDAWHDLGFLVKSATANPGFYQQERNDVALGEPVASGSRTLGRSKRRTPNDPKHGS